MSSPRSTKKADIEDLSTRARRIGLSADDQRQFDRACEASPALRISGRSIRFWGIELSAPSPLWGEGASLPCGIAPSRCQA